MLVAKKSDASRLEGATPSSWSFLRDAPVHRGVYLYAEHLCCRIAAFFPQPSTGCAQKDASPECRIEHCVGRAANGPPHQELGDLRVGVIRAESFVRILLARFDRLVHDCTLYRSGDVHALLEQRQRVPRRHIYGYIGRHGDRLYENHRIVARC